MGRGSTAHGWRGAAALALIAAVGALPASASAAGNPKLKVTAATPALFPAFKSSVHDYVSRCNAKTPLALDLAVGKDTSASINGKAPHRGTFKRTLNLRVGERAKLVAKRGKRSSTYSIRCLPNDFPQWTAERPGKPGAQWYLVSPTIAIGKPPGHYAAFFDRNGVPVWWLKVEQQPNYLPSDVRLLPNLHVVLARRIDTFAYALDPRQQYEEHRLDGSTVHDFKAVGAPTDDHDFAYLPNGNHMLLTYRPRGGVDLSPYGGPSDAFVVDGELQEITPGGKVVWKWSTKDHLSLDEVVPRWWGAVLARTAVPANEPYDPIHVNSFAIHGNRVLVSARQTDAIYDVDRKTGKIVWKLGGVHTAQSLGFKDDPFSDFGGQHDARVLDDGTVTLHDNGSGLNRPPRAVRYRINEKAHTATLLEQLSDPEAPGSFFLGGARRLPDGHWVVSWGGNSLVTELAASGKRLFALHFAGGLVSYRVFPVLPGTLGATRLRRAMDALTKRDQRNESTR